MTNLTPTRLVPGTTIICNQRVAIKAFTKALKDGFVADVNLFSSEGSELVQSLRYKPSTRGERGL
jgi:hypothetical protein